MDLIQRNTLDILEIKEEITIKNIDEFKYNMKRFIDESKERLILNLEQVTYLNSSALGIIAETAMNAKKAGKELVIAGVKPPLDEIFNIVKFDTFMKLFSSLEEATQYYLQ